MVSDITGAPAVLHGGEALEHVARLAGVDCVLLAVSGFKGVRPALAALRAGKDVALATKEALVSAGEVPLCWSPLTAASSTVCTAHAPGVAYSGCKP